MKRSLIGLALCAAMLLPAGACYRRRTDAEIASSPERGKNCKRCKQRDCKASKCHKCHRTHCGRCSTKAAK